MKNRSFTLRAAALAAVLPVAGAAQAAFVLVENFDDLVLGPIDEQGAWYAASATSEVAADPAAPGNLVLAVTTDSTHLHRDTLLLNGTTRMLFLRFRIGEQQNFSFGLSGSTFPSQFGHFEPELGMSNATNELRINDGGTYDVLTLIQPDTWYNCWMLINNEADVTQVYLHDRDGDAAQVSDRLEAGGQTWFQFRSGAAANLRTFFIKTGGGSGPSGPLYLDDIYLENTHFLNFQNPSGGTCPADVDGSGAVDLPDFLEVLAAWDQSGVPADVNGDTVVDVLDFLEVLSAWGPCP
jgi:hypothetical protein